MGSRTVTGSVIAAIGALLVAAAAVLYWVVLPAQAKLPADTDTTRQYEGTAKLLIQPQALALGDRSRAVVINAPVTASRTVKVLATDGNAAEISESRTLATAAGQAIGQVNATYAVDRKTLEATDNHPSDWSVTQHDGLTVSWPIGAKKQDYTGWVNETKTTTPITYVREETRNGITTYVYQANAKAAAIKDQQVLASLPQALPASALQALGTALPLPDQLKQQLAALLPQLTQPVPLTYTYAATATYWVEPTTGTVVDVQREETRQAALALPGGVTTPALPIYDVATHNTSASVSAATDEAQNDANKITWYGKTLPLILLVFGVLGLVGGGLLIVLGRRRPAPAA